MYALIQLGDRLWAQRQRRTGLTAEDDMARNCSINVEKSLASMSELIREEAQQNREWRRSRQEELRILTASIQSLSVASQQSIEVARMRHDELMRGMNNIATKDE